MPAIEEDLLLVRFRSSKEAKERLLRCLVWEDAVEPATQHQHGNADAPKETHRVLLRPTSGRADPGDIQHGCTEPRLDGQHHARDPRSPARADEAESRGVDLRTGRGIIN